MASTIQISDEVKKLLDSMKLMERESYNDIIAFMIEDGLELKESVKREVTAALKRIDSGKAISHEEAKKRLGL